MFHRSRRNGTVPKSSDRQNPSDIENASSHGSDWNVTKRRSSDLSTDDDPANESSTSPERSRSSGRPGMRTNPFFLILLLISIIAILFLWSRKLSRGWWALIVVSSVPILLATSVAVGAPWKSQPHQRLIAVFVVGSILCGQLPRSLAAALVAAGVLCYSLTTRPLSTSSQQPQQQHDPIQTAAIRRGQLRAAVGAILTTLSLMVENFFVWVVSATYKPSHLGSPTPLQDNGRLLQQYLLETTLHLSQSQLRLWRATLQVQWALVAGLAASLAVCELHWVKRRTLWGVVQRALLTFASARLLRTVSFLLTVLPSQKPDCYRQHYGDPPPQEWMPFLQMGLLPQAHGGCNDLIVSGHAVVTTVLACVATSLAGHAVLSVAVWMLVALDYGVEVYEGFHYSVDMWMGALVTSLLWRVMEPVEHNEQEQQMAVLHHKRELHRLTDVDLLTLAQYVLPAVGGFVAIAVFPESAGNYWLLLYLFIASLQIARNGFSHLVQHELFMVLYIALGTYL